MKHKQWYSSMRMWNSLSHNELFDNVVQKKLIWMDDINRHSQATRLTSKSSSWLRKGLSGLIVAGLAEFSFLVQSRRPSDLSIYWFLLGNRAGQPSQAFDCGHGQTSLPFDRKLSLQTISAALRKGTLSFYAEYCANTRPNNFNARHRQTWSRRRRRMVWMPERDNLVMNWL
jgi:hypothetical protein